VLFFADSLYKSKDMSVEEVIESANGSLKEIRKIKLGESYINKTKQSVKFFIGEQVGGSLSSGGQMTLEQPVDKNTTLKLSIGIARFRIKSLKEEAFVVKTPSAVAGVRGTSFSVYLEGDDEKITLPEGRLDITKDDKTVSLNAGEKVAITKGELQNKTEMSAEESGVEMNLILGEVRYRNIKIEKAIESYDEKHKYYKEKIDSGKAKEEEKLQKVIDDEIKKAERGADIKMMDELEHLKTNLTARTSNQTVQKYMELYNVAIEKINKKYQPTIEKENEKLEKVFLDEIARALKDNDKSLARDLDAWKDGTLQTAKVHPKYFSSTEGRGGAEFLEDGRVRINGEKGTYVLKGNLLEITYQGGPYDGCVIVNETRDAGNTFRLIMIDRDNKLNKRKSFTYETSDQEWRALNIEIAPVYKQLPTGEIWNLADGVLTKNGEKLRYKIDNGHLIIFNEKELIAAWETRDNGITFRLVKTKNLAMPYESSKIELISQK